MLKVTTPAEPRFKSKFVVRASGYWGDMDAAYKVEVPIVAPHSAEHFYQQHLDIQNAERSNLTVDDLWDEDSYWEWEYHIPTDEGECLPHIEKLEIHWYDANGNCYNVEVE